MSVLQIPSYGQGFARCRSECAYPQLWDGLAGLWAPYLGATGGTLRDTSGYGNHGTLTNMDPATDWVTTGKGYALDFDRSDDYVDIDNNPYSIDAVKSNGLSIAATIYLTSLTFGSAQTGGVIGGAGAEAHSYYSAGGIWLVRGTSSTGALATIYDGAYRTATSPYYLFSLGVNHVAMTLGVSDNYVRLYINGRDVAASAAVTMASLSFDPNVFWLGRMLTFYSWVQLLSGAIWLRRLASNEIAALYRDPHAPSRLRRRTVVRVPDVGPSGGLRNPLSMHSPLSGAL